MITIIISAVLIAGFLTGLWLMKKPHAARYGNRLSAICMALAILYTVYELDIGATPAIWALIGIGGALGILLGQRVKMIQMPQLVALLNGFGGAASAAVAGAALAISSSAGILVLLAAVITLAVGSLTFFGSMIAALKLNGTISTRALLLRGHSYLMGIILSGGCVLIILSVLYPGPAFYLVTILFAAYGVLMALRIGGADMPIIISFLNSMSGIAAAVCGFAVNNLLLVGSGALVGVAGMILTQIMCKAMNRNLRTVLSGFRTSNLTTQTIPEARETAQKAVLNTEDMIPKVFREAQKVIIVPGYGMAVSQAQQQVKKLIDAFEKAGKSVKIAIHPVAGRMPGHMNVLLAEVDIPYEMFSDMDTVNAEFDSTDLVVAVGACDVINPAANTAEGTPIYGMPILEVELARHILICNLDQKPGYSGVENTLYGKKNVFTLWGDAAETVSRVTTYLSEGSD